MDFEHCRADAREADFVKLAQGPWAQNPLSNMLFGTATGSARIEWFSVLFALATLAWTAAGREPERLAQARSLLASRSILGT